MTEALVHSSQDALLGLSDDTSLLSGGSPGFVATADGCLSLLAPYMRQTLDLLGYAVQMVWVKMQHSALTSLKCRHPVFSPRISCVKEHA